MKNNKNNLICSICVAITLTCIVLVLLKVCPGVGDFITAVSFSIGGMVGSYIISKNVIGQDLSEKIKELQDNLSESQRKLLNSQLKNMNIKRVYSERAIFSDRIDKKLKELYEQENNLPGACFTLEAVKGTVIQEFDKFLDDIEKEKPL